MTKTNADPYDAILILSFGGPEGPADVMPFLEHVLQGRNVPVERKQEVARHYELFGGVSPLNAQNRALKSALEKELHAHGISLPVYLGNRNWHPFVADTLKIMKEYGLEKFLVFVTSAFSSYSGCRQYWEDLEKARQNTGLEYDKIRVFYNHPNFIEVWRENLAGELNIMPDAHVVFTAHSIPVAMSERCDYVAQLKDACTLVAEAAGIGEWKLAYQSRSGSPHQPWLDPDIGEHLREYHAGGGRDVVIAPIGFTSDHLEVQYDLDHEARALCSGLGLRMVRARTPGTHPRFVTMIRELIEERIDPSKPKLALGSRGPKEDVCPANCCLPN